MKKVRNAAKGGAATTWMLALLALGGCATQGPDPWEGPNRAIFQFNETVDRWVMEPAAEGWDFVMPERAEQGVTNFFANLRMPLVFLNNLLQAKPVAAGQDVGRFVVNTTVGVAGFFDVASRLDIPAHDEDFGQTLGYYGLSPGPYMVLPLLGPSSVRDTVGLGVDGVSRPEVWLIDLGIRLGAAGIDAVNTRAQLLEEVRESRESAFDFYVFVRNAYLSNRARKVRDGEPQAEESADDLYYVDELEESPPEDEPAQGDVDDEAEPLESGPSGP